MATLHSVQKNSFYLIYWGTIDGGKGPENTRWDSEDLWKIGLTPTAY